MTKVKNIKKKNDKVIRTVNADQQEKYAHYMCFQCYLTIERLLLATQIRCQSLYFFVLSL